MTRNNTSAMEKQGRESIHSGHFMVSEFEAEAQDDEEDVAIPVPDEDQLAQAAMVPGQRSFLTRMEEYFQKEQGVIPIDKTLTKLFQCMTIAYRQKLTSPKWNRFRGLKLRWKDKIRLNNLIWRAWHMQFIKKKSARMCQFASPLDVDTHSKPEAIIMEGKYWKRRTQAVSAEYKKWRLFFKNKKDKNNQELNDMDIGMDTSPSPLGSFLDSLCSGGGLEDDFMDFTDTLFQSLVPPQPFQFPNPRELNRGCGLPADIIQPGLVPLQPNLDDFMDTLEPLQEMWMSSSKLAPVLEEHHESMMAQSPVQQHHRSSDLEQASQSHSVHHLTPEDFIREFLNSQAQQNQTSSNHSSSSERLFSPTAAPVPAAKTPTRRQTPALQSPHHQVNLLNSQSTNVISNPPSQSAAPKVARTSGRQSAKMLRTSGMPKVESDMGTRVTKAILQRAHTEPGMVNEIVNVLSVSSDPRLSLTRETPLVTGATLRTPPPLQSQLQQVQQTVPLTIAPSRTQPLHQVQSAPTLRPATAQRTPPLHQVHSAPTMFSAAPTIKPDVLPERKAFVSTSSQAITYSLPQPSAIYTSMLPTTVGTSLSQPQYDGTVRRHSSFIPGANSGRADADNGLSTSETVVIPTVIQAASQKPPTPKDDNLFAVPATTGVIRHRARSRSASSLATQQIPTDKPPPAPVAVAPAPTSSTKQTEPVLAQIIPAPYAVKQEPEMLPTVLAQSPVMLCSVSTPTLLTANAPATPVCSTNSSANSGVRLKTVPVASTSTGSSLMRVAAPPSVIGLQSVVASQPIVTGNVLGLKPAVTGPPTSPTLNPSPLSASPTNMFTTNLPSPTSPSIGKAKTLALGPDKERAPYKVHERRRVCHINAEQKRRCNIKNGFDVMHSLIPSLQSNPSAKVSKATLLARGTDYIKQLKGERAQLQEEAENMRAQIEELNKDIGAYQAQLPATGAPISRTVGHQMEELFENYQKERTLQDYKWWVFSTLLHPLLESFNKQVSTQSLDDLYRTSFSWLDQSCGLMQLRPVVLSQLRTLSTTTSVLSEPSRLADEAVDAVMKKELLSSPRKS